MAGTRDPKKYKSPNMHDIKQYYYPQERRDGELTDVVVGNTPFLTAQPLSATLTGRNRVAAGRAIAKPQIRKVLIAFVSVV